ncbi:MAG: HlyD family secretion protein [Chitinophagaceae bacterium]|nr:HlyD family secretion protein [Chitinophagaceae bacterium]
MSTSQPAKKKNRSFMIILIIVLVVGGSFGTYKYVHSLHHEETDDAQVEANISPVIPRIPGYVNSVFVSDNQRVKKGDTLFVLDNRDMLVKLQQAEAALATSRSGLAAARTASGAANANIYTSQASVAAVNAQIEAAKINVWRNTQDFNRYANLIKDHSITQQQYEQALAAKQTAEKQLQVLLEQKEQASRQTNAVASQSTATASQISIASATIKEREAEVEQAKLNLSYTIITAPEDGYVSKVNVRAGQYVQAGAAVFSIVRDNDIWVVGNFKETQLENIREGQPVVVNVDAFPGHDFKAKIASFSPATGSRFALLPPDNASGNFVKVVQRLPVKIEFTESDSLVKRLRAGLNVNVDVHIN